MSAWPAGISSCELHSNFVSFLTDTLGHAQLINSPTHKSGNTLDLLFTNVQNLVKDVKVLDHNEMRLSDHFGIRLNLDVKTILSILNSLKERFLTIVRVTFVV